MTEFEASVGETHLWDAEFAKLRQQFANATDGTIFCIYKLQQNPHSRLRDFRQEADLHGLKATGASFHSARVLLGMDKRKERKKSDEEELWECAERRLKKEFPDATRGILFCVYKLRQDTTLAIPNFREEATEHGIKLGGRALHSARKLLGLVESREGRLRGGSVGSNGSGLEAEMILAIQQMQEEASAEVHRLRAAIQQVIGTVERALE